jgi:UDP-N-acetylglucosamine--N-acetylmuramyl-(pentapeptide) pyrophosphoryl-undecaprenol N-acetylglucosamine transferase
LQRAIKVIISGGGTGGHIFPALAIANALKKLNSDNEILFVGALGKMEMEKVPAAGFKIIGLNIRGLHRRITMANLSFPFRLVGSVMKSKKIIREFKPDAAVGVGGYASGPLLWAASSSKIPSLIQEQNSYPGITNIMLAKRVKKICVAYEGMEKFFPADKIVMTGNPVRQDISDIAEKKNEALEFFGLNKDKKTILVLGGSLGALTINESMAAGIEKINSAGVQLLWQTGKGYLEKAKVFNSENVKVFDFINRMDLAYAPADVVISRAGALSVSELCIAGKPVIFVPSPNVTADHQSKNAKALTDKNAAMLISDNEARQKLIDETLTLLKNERKCLLLGENISAFAKHDAAKQIAGIIYDMTENND